MKLKLTRLLVCLMCAVTFITAISVSPATAAPSESQLRNDIANLQKQSAAIQAEINKLKKDAADKQAILAAVQKKVANTQAQINRCNAEINSINAKISANKAEINSNNKKIEENKLAFKKRIRAIYMSNSDSNVKILLGAESFSDYLQLAQLTSAVSAHDRQIIEDIVEVIDALNAKNAENEKLLKSQVEVKNTINEQLKALEADEAEAASIYNDVLKDKKAEEQHKATVDAAIKDKQNDLNRFAQSGNIGSFINSNTGLMWPVPYTRQISSYWGERWGTMHKGIDISAGGIYGKPIVAIADGVVTETYNGCSHQTKESRCRCGSGWGNHVKMDHGIYKGNTMGAIYAHMTHPSVSPGQKVKRGDVIGWVGTTGDSTGYHLHLSLLINRGYVDPLPYVW